MKNIIYNIRPIVLTLLLVASFATTTLAQEVQIPDPGLNAAIRAALQKPSGPLTQQDMLSLTVLSARSRNIGNLQGLEFAHNLTDLDLESNHLTNLAFPGGLTKLQFVDLSLNPLTNLTLSTDMTNLVSLELFSDQLTSLTVPAQLRNLVGIDVENNRLTSLNLPSTLNRLDFLIASGNQLTSLTLPAGLTAMTDLEVFANGLASLRCPDASNYCAKLTQRELAVGRIPAGTQYRLPTGAEWECAARAGTSTRFSFGDDPAYTELRNHSWFAANSGLTPHPVGQKLHNPWGLYDMEGNVVEWCQDWFASLPGGVQTDPTGPASSASGRKVVRGGAFDNTEQSCRSATRLLFSAIPPLTDTDLGFRVVLISAPQ